MEQEHDDIYEVYLFGKQFPEVVIKLELIPSLVVIQVHPEMTRHVNSLIKSFNSLIFHYDTTFDVGTFYTSILSLRHPAFKKEPIIPVALMFHESTTEINHHTFFKSIEDHLEFNKCKPIIVTDREIGIRNAIKQELPGARNLFCWNHIRKV